MFQIISSQERDFEKDLERDKFPTTDEFNKIINTIN